MKESPTENETTMGSNPAGVAAQTTPEETGNPDRTELRSVATHEDPRVPRRPAPGDKVEVLYRSQIGKVWIGAVVEAVWTDGAGSFDWRGQNNRVGRTSFNETDEWRWPNRLEVPGLAGRIDALAAADQFNRCDACGTIHGGVCDFPDQPPEVRRCTAITTGHDVDTDYPCGAVLGTIKCDVCSGARCYHHCEGIDHFGGRVVDQGGGEFFPWKIAEIAAGRFRGQVLLRRQKGEPTIIIGTAYGVSVDEVRNTLALHLGHDRARRAEAPRVTVGLAALDFLTKADKVGPDKRTELAEEVIAWLRASEESWQDEVYIASYDSIDAVLEAAKKWHDRQIAGLFSRLAGAL